MIKLKRTRTGEIFYLNGYEILPEEPNINPPDLWTTDFTSVATLIGGYSVFALASKVTAFFNGKSYIVKNREMASDFIIPIGRPDYVIVEFN